MANRTEIYADAETIAKLIISTPAEDRHELYGKVARIMQDATQGYTAGLFRSIEYADRNGLTVKLPRV